MIAVIRSVEDVGVVQLAESHQFAENLFDSLVDALQRLQTFRHQQVGETVVDRFHFAEPAQNPLLVRIGRKVVAGRPVSRHVEKHVRILRSRIFGTVRRRETHDHHKRLVVETLFRFPQETDGIVGDQIRIIIRLIVIAVFNLQSIQMN